MSDTGIRTDINFYFGPLGPFAWMTSKWVRIITAQRAYDVDWRFISLRLINAHIHYDTHFPAGYVAGHTAGLRLLRVAAKARAEHGRAAVGRLCAAIGPTRSTLPPNESQTDPALPDAPAFLEPVLTEAGLPPVLVGALDDESFDAELRSETDEALALAGKDVGTPIIHFQPPGRSRVFRPRHQPPPQQAGCRAIVGPRRGSGRLPGLRRVETQPARTTPPGQLRRNHRSARDPGRLARR
jgi:hypothetical protein